MANILADGEIFTVIGLVVPGFIIAKVRQQFITGQREAVSKELLEYLTFGAINFAFFSWLIYLLGHGSLGIGWRATGWLVVILIGPVVLGMASGIAAQKGLKHRLLGAWPFRLVDVKSVHAVPTAWDWKFSKMPGQFVLIYLKDGRYFAGYCGADSFISSNPNERDLYVEDVYDLDENDKWIKTRKSLLVLANEISTIEFWKDEVHERRKEGLCTEYDNSDGRETARGTSTDDNRRIKTDIAA